MTIPKEALKCRKCGKTDVEFPEQLAKMGRKSWCISCVRAYYAGYRDSHRDDTNRRMREWREKNREHARKQSLDWQNKAYKANPEFYRQKSVRLRQKLKDDVYAAYGGYSCRCCGETIPEFLTIDHIASNGADHRREINARGGDRIFRWLRQNNYPEGFQVLCWNCQWGKRRAGVCPHQRTSND